MIETKQTPESPREIADKLRQKIKQASDIEAALFWQRELAKPCFPPGHPEQNVGGVYLREAKRDLARMTALPIEARNPFAISILEEAIGKYEQNK